MRQCSGSAPFVMIVKPADIIDFDYAPAINFINFTMLGTIPVERKMRARAVIVVEKFSNNSPKMPLT